MRSLFLFIVLLLAVFTAIAVRTDIEPLKGMPEPSSAYQSIVAP